MIDTTYYIIQIIYKGGRVVETLNNIVLTIQHYLADYILIIALLGGGIWFTLRLGFIQVRGFGEGMRRTFGGLFHKKGDADADGMSSFQALATAIAAQVGTGNIAGAATAIAIGGPGAIFWMWIAAFLGMATIYAEALMAQKYKQVGVDGEVTGGPVYYIRAAFSGKFGKFLAALFAVLIIFALGFMGNAVQSNSIAASFHTAFGIPQPVMGVIVAVIAFFCIRRWYEAYRESNRDHRSGYGSTLYCWSFDRYYCKLEKYSLRFPCDCSGSIQSICNFRWSSRCNSKTCSYKGCCKRTFL